MKAPAFQFYVGDYMQDTRMISLAARGAWMDLLCAMWRSPNRGQLTSTILGYARLFGCTVEQAKAVIEEIADSQVCDSVTHGDGKVTLTCRRMYREAKEREGANMRQKRYRERQRRESDGPEDEEGDAEVTPPSSSSPSTAKQKPSAKAGAAAPNGQAPPGSLNGKSPPHKPPDTVWTLGVQMLTQAGIDEQEARSFIGKLVKDNGKDRVAQAVASTSAQNPVNPREYLVQVLRQGGIGSDKPTGSGRGATTSARSERQNRNAAALITGAAQRVAAGEGRLRGGG